MRNLPVLDSNNTRWCFVYCRLHSFHTSTFQNIKQEHSRRTQKLVVNAKLLLKSTWVKWTEWSDCYKVTEIERTAYHSLTATESSSRPLSFISSSSFAFNSCLYLAVHASSASGSSANKLSSSLEELLSSRTHLDLQRDTGWPRESHQRLRCEQTKKACTWVMFSPW